MLRFASLCAAAIALAVVPVHAIIDYNFANDATTITSAPANGAPWAAVARNTDAAGTVGSTATYGTSIHLGNGFMLTANHNIDLFYDGPYDMTHVQFEVGGPTYAIDTSFTPQQVTTGGGDVVDLAVFRLQSNPGVAAAQLYDGLTSELGLTATVVGWGVGRANAGDVGADSQSWGAKSTTSKRWGTNVITNNVQPISYSTGGVNYLETSIQFVLGNNQGDYEASLGDRDSGSAFFIEVGGSWYLAGVGVIAGNPSVFDSIGPAESGNTNYGVLVSDYAEAIDSLLPEPRVYALLAGAGVVAVVLRRRRQRG